MWDSAYIYLSDFGASHHQFACIKKSGCIFFPTTHKVDIETKETIEIKNMSLHFRKKV